MRVTGLIVPLLLLPLLLHAQTPYGSPVTAIAIDGAPDSVLDDVAIQPGDVLTPEGLKTAIQSLYDEGGYAEIEVEAGPDQGGVRLTFHVEAPYFFSTIRMEPVGLLERPLSSYLNLPYGERFSTDDVGRIVADLDTQLQAEGYFGAQLTPSWSFDDTTRLVTTRIQVEPGVRARVGRIELEGGQQTLTDDEMQDAFEMRPNDRFLRTRVLEGVDAIRERFSALLFLNTRVRVEEAFDPDRNAVDLRLIIEPGLFTFVDLRGYDQLSTSDLRELIPVYEEGRLDPELIEEGRIELLEYLRREGYLQAQVTSEFFEAPFDAAYQINYNIETGDRFSIHEVRVEGNSFFTSAILHERIGLSREGWFTRGVFSPELLDQAEETIRRLYEASGFTDTVVRSDQRQDGNQITVLISIEEGRRIEVGNVFFSGNVEIGDAELVSAAGLSSGQLFAPGVLQAGRRALTTRYHDAGYPEVQVSAVTERTSDQRVDITYRIVEGLPSRIRRIFVSGNVRTREKIVHRNSPLVEGAPYDPESVLEAQRQLYATGLFTRVDIVTLDRPRLRQRDLLIQLEDARPILLTYGVGVQDREGPRGTVELSHSNLWGLDRSISFRIRGSRREQRFQTTYREPRLFNWELDGFASLFIERLTEQFFDASRVDFSIQSLKRFENLDSFLMSASYQTVNLRDIRLNPRTSTFPDERGIIQIARLGMSYVRDGRNDPLNPSRGNYFTGNFQMANRALGSEVNFTSLFTQASIYRPANGAVLAASVRFGWNQPYGPTEALPITERYFAGGSTTLRGFSLDHAGPEGGGNALTILNAEYRFPIRFPFDGLGGAVFYDTGTTFAGISDFSIGDFTHTAGFGFRYQTPLGPIRVDLGLNLNRQAGESLDKVFFTLGHAF